MATTTQTTIHPADLADLDRPLTAAERRAWDEYLDARDARDLDRFLDATSPETE